MKLTKRLKRYTLVAAVLAMPMSAMAADTGGGLVADPSSMVTERVMNTLTDLGPSHIVQLPVPAGVEVTKFSTSPLYQGILAEQAKAEAAFKARQAEQAKAEGKAVTHKVDLLGTSTKAPSDELTGKFFDYYQLRKMDDKGLHVAEVITVNIPESAVSQLPVDYSTINNPMVVEMGKSLINAQLPKAQSALNDLLAKNTSAIPVSIHLLDLQPVSTVAGTAHPTLMTSGRVQADIGGFVLPLYADVAVIATPGSPNAIVFMTSDTERQTFSPIFDNILKNIR